MGWKKRNIAVLEGSIDREPESDSKNFVVEQPKNNVSDMQFEKFRTLTGVY